MRIVNVFELIVGLSFAALGGALYVFNNPEFIPGIITFMNSIDLPTKADGVKFYSVLGVCCLLAAAIAASGICFLMNNLLNGETIERLRAENKSLSENLARVSGENEGLYETKHNLERKVHDLTDELQSGHLDAKVRDNLRPILKEMSEIVERSASVALRHERILDHFNDAQQRRVISQGIPLTAENHVIFSQLYVILNKMSRTASNEGEVMVEGLIRFLTEYGEADPSNVFSPEAVFVMKMISSFAEESRFVDEIDLKTKLAELKKTES